MVWLGFFRSFHMKDMIERSSITFGVIVNNLYWSILIKQCDRYRAWKNFGMILSHTKINKIRSILAFTKHKQKQPILGVNGETKRIYL